MEEYKTISPREQLLVITAALILAGIASNYSTISPSSSHIIISKAAARDLLDSILDGKKL